MSKLVLEVCDVCGINSLDAEVDILSMDVGEHDVTGGENTNICMDCAENNLRSIASNGHPVMFEIDKDDLSFNYIPHTMINTKKWEEVLDIVFDSDVENKTVDDLIDELLSYDVIVGALGMTSKSI